MYQLSGSMAPSDLPLELLVQLEQSGSLMPQSGLLQVSWPVLVPPQVPRQEPPHHCMLQCMDAAPETPSG